MEDLPNHGRVVIKGNQTFPDGNYIFFKGQNSEQYFITLSYQDRHPTRKISDTCLRKYLNK